MYIEEESSAQIVTGEFSEMDLVKTTSKPITTTTVTMATTRNHGNNT